MSFGGQQMPMASNMGQQQQMGQNQPQGLMPMYPGMAPQSGMMPQMGQMPQGQMGGIGGLMPEYMAGMSQAYSQPMGEVLPQDPTKVDMRPTSMSQPSSMDQPSSLGTMPSYRPTMGPINGAEVASRMDVRQPRQMAGLPGSIANQLPPSLKRPTQGSYNKFK